MGNADQRAPGATAVDRRNVPKRRTPGGRTRGSGGVDWLRGTDSNRRPSGYEPDELPLLHPATAHSTDARRDVKRSAATAPPPVATPGGQYGCPTGTSANDGVARAHHAAHRAGHVHTAPNPTGPSGRFDRPGLPRSACGHAVDEPHRPATDRRPRPPEPPRRHAGRRPARPARARARVDRLLIHPGRLELEACPIGRAMPGVRRAPRPSARPGDHAPMAARPRTPRSRRRS